MVKVRISYDRDSELMAITSRLEDLALRISKRPVERGTHKNVWLHGDVKDASATSPGSEAHH